MGQEDIQAFLAQCQSMQADIRQIQGSVQELRQLQRRTQNAVRESDRLRYQRHLEDQLQRATSMTKSVRQRMSALQQQSRSAPRSQRQLMESQYLDLAKKFRDAVVLFHDAQMEIQAQEKQQLERQLRIVRPHATEEEIKSWVDDQQPGASQIFAQTLLESTRREEAQRVLNQVQSRHDHVLKMAKSIVELQTMFEDLSTMISSQDDAVMKVSAQVDDVEANTAHATKELHVAVNNARSARKKKWCLIIFFILLVLGVVLYFVFDKVVIPMINNKVNNATK